ncbi:hypothetical protein NA57DRAFT_76742 [Rhizodiscina lignyota]|uniref:Non-structural maintenance of chromosomes element 1 homolog n=1 Tax=Rhizodiscina lignyota TaxID=1504668 RepID=A0A9P4IE10_9PEZI|nr:hypothetical protein NA57DRAFT_76742 [Rhizodiscina lignyota]
MGSEDGDISDYNNSHRAFLQVFLARSVMTFEEAQPILANILSVHDRPTHINDVDLPLFRSYIHTINAALSRLDYEIRHTIHQTDNSRRAVYALVNTTSDPQTQLATSLSADEVAFVKRVLDAMFDTHGGGHAGGREVFAVKEMEAIQLAKVPRGSNAARDSGVGMSNDGRNGETQQLPIVVGGSAAPITMQRAQEVLDQMVESGFFERSDAGYYSLGTRGLMELRAWLQETYDEPAQEGDTPEEVERGKRIRFCEACRDVATVGQRCANQECGFRLHDFCVQKFFHGRREKKCPKCNTEWTDKSFVGERAARGYAESRRRSGAGGRRSNATSRRTTNVGDEDSE